MNTKEIRKKTLLLMQKSNFPIHPYLPLLDIKALRAKDEICQRIIALYSLAGIANGEGADMLRDWLVEEGGWKFLSELEKAVILSQQLSSDDLNELSWKEESLYILCWAGDLVSNLPSPGELCELERIFEHIPPEKSFSEFFTSLTPRSPLEIVEVLDFHYCLHASIVHPELWENNEINKNINRGLVLERRQALEWLCSTSVDWGDISLDT